MPEFVGTRSEKQLAHSGTPRCPVARELALLPDQVASVLAAKPYDLRHACVSQWLNSGVPAPEVARRAGHWVEVLHKIYAKCVDSQGAEMNDRIMKGLGEEPET